MCVHVRAQSHTQRSNKILKRGGNILPLAVLGTVKLVMIRAAHFLFTEYDAGSMAKAGRVGALLVSYLCVRLHSLYHYHITKV